MDSLRVDEDLMIALADGDIRARAISESWKFNQPVTLMSSEDLDSLSERCRTVFSFSSAKSLNIDVCY